MFEEVIDNQSLNLLLRLPPITDESINDARSQFEIYDSDRNGIMEEEELDSYFRQNIPELRCFSTLIIQYCGSNNGIDSDQFCKMYRSLTVGHDSNEFIGRHIFDLIDSDHNGIIETSELNQFIDIIHFPNGMKSDAIERAKKGMNYEDFSKLFYILLKMGWKRILRRYSI